MIDFKVCYPDANNFNKVIKLKSVENWKTEYVELDYGIGYWIAEDPFEDNGYELFKGLIASFPIQKDNNHPDNRDPNPFDTIHVPEWISKDLCFLVKDFYLKHIRTDIAEPQIHEWGNVYFKERARPISCWRIPHIDYVHGMVANLWFTSHDMKDSSTKLYKYHGVIHNDVYDFQIDTKHPMYEEWKSIADVPTRADSWFNMAESELARWGFECVGSIPNTERTISMYQANVCHSAWVSEDVKFRWSHAFAFSHEIMPPLTLGDYLQR